ncbi:MAG: 1-deoxy-D-xylulose-5-phosphate synthase [Syntrophomonadaceae bacterium]|nr:1-deoxy-D-xylulose-5-phosphate synthase [Syntrophomonadaceae bacterium]
MYPLLDTINYPADIKNLAYSQLDQLADEIRAFLVENVSLCGGHLGPSLGVVELTLALHYVFDCPGDRMVWDVGHQSYTHKILTGRRERMNTLRQFGGLAGFPKREESEYDSFNTGHSSTSISAALGMALARDLQQEAYSVIAVIGDGALTGGMSFEALNHAGNEGSDLIIILNDNEMSINKNVGAMSSYLNRLRTDPRYFKSKRGLEEALHKIPLLGSPLARGLAGLKDMVKYVMVAGSLFESLGLTYVGPVKGHDMDELITVLSNVKQMKGPVLVHTITEKGHGYEPAIQAPDVFHGIGPFDAATGKPLKKRVLTYTQVFGDALLRAAADDERIVAITAAMTSGTGLTAFAAKWPERFFDVGICEQHAVTLAAGMASMGLRPVVCIYSTFLQRAYDQLVHDVALQNLPVVFAIDRAGLVGEDGPTHHGVFDLSYLRSIPNFTIMAAANENELADMLHTAFTVKGPVALRYPRGAGEAVPVRLERSLLPLGKAERVRHGDDIALLAVGRAFSVARDVAQLLESSGISVELINARFIKPLDVCLLDDVAGRIPRIVTLEENMLGGGFGSAVLEYMADSGYSVDTLRIGIPDEFVEHGRVELLFDLLNFGPSDIAARIVSRWPELAEESLRRKKGYGPA